MSTRLPLNIEMGALPPNAMSTPQQLADMIAARLFITTQQALSLFVSGSTEPSSDVGPWAKNGNTWYYYNTSTGDYEPMLIEAASLGYFIGSAAPDPTVYSFWIETTAGGSPLALKIYYSGAWTDVYASQLAAYLTIAGAAATYLTIAAAAAGYQPLNANLTLLTSSVLGDIIYSSATDTLSKLGGNTSAAKRFLTQTGTGAVSAAPAWAAIVAGDIPDISATYLTVVTAAATYQTIAGMASYLTTAAAAATYQTQAAMASYSTTAQMSTAISNAAFLPYVAQGTNAAAQTIAADGVAVKVTYDQAPINPSPAPFSTASSRYIAPAAGYYMVAVTTQFDNVDATASGVEVQLSLYKNNSGVGIGDTDGTPSPNGSRWSPSFTTMIQLATNDYIEIFAQVADGVGTGDVELTTTRMSVWRVSA